MAGDPQMGSRVVLGWIAELQRFDRMCLTKHILINETEKTLLPFLFFEARFLCIAVLKNRGQSACKKVVFTFCKDINFSKPRAFIFVFTLISYSE